MMHATCVTDGSCWTCLQHARVAKHSACNMRSIAHLVGYAPYNTMRFVNHWLNACAKLVTLVEVEPKLQELSGEVFEWKSANKDDEARSDIKCCGFWSNMRQAYFDVKVVSPFARSYAHMKPAALFQMAELSKIREYGERIRQVEHADFNPFVFTCTGGLAPQSHLVLKRLAETLSKKQNISSSVVSGWLRCRLSFLCLVLHCFVFGQRVISGL